MLVEVVEHVAEVEILALDGVAVGVFLVHFDGLRLLVQHHQATLVATCDAEGLLLAFVVFELAINAMRIKSDELFW